MSELIYLKYLEWRNTLNWQLRAFVVGFDKAGWNVNVGSFNFQNKTASLVGQIYMVTWIFKWCQNIPREFIWCLAIPMRSGKHRRASKKIIYIDFSLDFLKYNYCNNATSNKNNNSNKPYLIVYIFYFVWEFLALYWFG